VTNVADPTPSGTSEDRLRLRFRLASFVVISSLLILTVTADTLGRLFFNPNFHSDSTIVLALIGAIAGYSTVEVLAQMQGKKGEGKNDRPS
jgi:O-antigen/teichoic acid export membrane protein